MPRAFRLLLLLSLLLTLFARTALAHDVKDPVCRMLVDSDTTTYREQIGQKTFYFCSLACRARFLAAPDRYVALADQLRKAKRRGYRVDFATEKPVTARTPTPLRFAIRYADNGALVHDFELVHEKRMHLVMVSDDLSWFEHQHPIQGSDGIFRLAWRFPHPGRYYLYADFTPADGDNQIQRVALTVPGFTRLRHLPLIADTELTKPITEGRVHLTVLPGLPLVAGVQSILTYTFTDDNGQPLRDMQPFVGAMGHLFAIREDGNCAVHTHALHGVAAGSYEAAILPVMQAGHDLVVTPEMVSPTGPTFTFKLTLPAPGLYRVWAQFMRRNRVVTVPFTLRAAGKSQATE